MLMLGCSPASEGAKTPTPTSGQGSYHLTLTELKNYSNGHADTSDFDLRLFFDPVTYAEAGNEAMAVVDNKTPIKLAHVQPIAGALNHPTNAQYFRRRIQLYGDTETAVVTLSILQPIAQAPYWEEGDLYSVFYSFRKTSNDPGACKICDFAEKDFPGLDP